jgi:hypothetical protein
MGLVKCLVNVTHRAFESQFSTIRSNDTARLLAAMLKRVEAEISQSCSVRMAVDSEHATLFTQLCDLDFCQLSCPGLLARGLRRNHNS